MQVYKLQVEGCCGPIVFRFANGVANEVKDLCENGETGDSFTVEIAEMSEAEVDALPEFQGY